MGDGGVPAGVEGGVEGPGGAARESRRDGRWCEAGRGGKGADGRGEGEMPATAKNAHKRRKKAHFWKVLVLVLEKK